MINIILATLIGFLLGRERKRHAKSGGGSRTLALICMSSCLVVIISQQVSLVYRTDMLRLMQGFIQGLGFVGAGLIWHNKGSVAGLTTASALIVVVIIGFLCGLGLYPYVGLTTIITYFLLEMKYWVYEKSDT